MAKPSAKIVKDLQDENEILKQLLVAGVINSEMPMSSLQWRIKQLASKIEQPKKMLKSLVREIYTRAVNDAIDGDKKSRGHGNFFRVGH